MLQNDIPPPVYRKVQACRLLGISDATVYRLVSAGELDLVKIGPRASGITRDSLVRFCDHRSIPLPSGF